MLRSGGRASGAEAPPLNGAVRGASRPLGSGSEQPAALEALETDLACRSSAQLGARDPRQHEGVPFQRAARVPFQLATEELRRSTKGD